MKLKATLSKLDKWGRLKYGDLTNKIKEDQVSLNQLKSRVPNADCIAQIKDVEESLDGLLAKEEIWWSQRAKVHWLKFGDRNTKFFHYKASQRKRKNAIHQISDP
jgi:hypothetical protein